jgi:hypothetical protein
MSNEKFRSFTEEEKVFAGKFRNQIKATEDLSDLRSCFSNTVAELLSTALARSVVIDGGDITFEPAQAGHFSLSGRLRDSALFMETWNNSNLPHIVGKAADTAHHRYLHLNKHQEKTEKKIRN